MVMSLNKFKIASVIDFYLTNENEYIFALTVRI